MDSTYLLFAVVLFVAVVLALEGAYLFWASSRSADAKRLAARLRTLESAPEQAAASIERQAVQRRWPWLDEKLLPLLPRGAELVRHVETSGTGRSAGELLVWSAALAVGGAAIPVLLLKVKN